MSQLLKVWATGILLGWILSSPLGNRGGEIVIILSYISQTVPIESPIVSIFLKNSIASLTTAFLGFLLCVLELTIYKKVTTNTYEFMELLTSPLYKALGMFNRRFRDTKPFFRSCLFYLLFVPLFTIFVNGLVMGLLSGFYFQTDNLHQYALSILPHALLEIPAMFASAFLGLKIFRMLEEPIIKSDLHVLQSAMKIVIDRQMIITAIFIQFILFFSALLETNSL